jgi:hypothetical protein
VAVSSGMAKAAARVTIFLMGLSSWAQGFWKRRRQM